MTPRYSPFLFALLVMGCASAPRVRQPQLRVQPPDSWAAAQVREAAGVGEAAADTLWWKGFADARLDTLVADQIRSEQASEKLVHARDLWAQAAEAAANEG